MGVLNLTIDKAPTRPNDNAKDDLTIDIINKVVVVKITKPSEKDFLFERLLPNF